MKRKLISQKCFQLLVTILLLNICNYTSDLFVGANEKLNKQHSSLLNKRQVSWLRWWSYDSISGPELWFINNRWKICATGKRQSPIEILTDRLVYDHLLGPLKFSWSEPAQINSAPATPKETVRGYLGTDANKGIELWFNDSNGESQSMTLEGGPLSYHYKLYKLELHSASSSFDQQTSGKSTISRHEDKVSEWSKTGKRTEHLIDGRDFDAELQLHFYNGDQLASGQETRRALEEASEGSERANLFAAISIFIQKSNQINSTGSTQLTLVEHFFSTLMLNLPKQWDSSNQQAPELTFKQSQLDALITSKTEFVTYQGSLNRPPCSENVDWIILNRALRVSSQLFDQLFGLSSINQLNTNQQQQSDNVRPVKPRHGRLLRTSINVARSAATLDRSSEVDACRATASADSQIKDLTTSNCTRQLAMAANSCSIRPNYIYELKYEKY